MLEREPLGDVTVHLDLVVQILLAGFLCPLEGRLGPLRQRVAIPRRRTGERAMPERKEVRITRPSMPNGSRKTVFSSSVVTLSAEVSSCGSTNTKVPPPR